MTRWDIFCQVIDNYGDAAVSWRLARQLTQEFDVSVRLWIDDFSPLLALCPTVNPQLSSQTIQQIEIHRWSHSSDCCKTPIATVVISAFGCRLPSAYLQHMALCTPTPRWINLEYLSAEKWVESCHTLPSPHPQLPLKQHFFFPGFTTRTGGLLREAKLCAQRDAFQSNPSAQQKFWTRLGCSPDENALKISFFGYTHAPLINTLKQWQHNVQPIYCIVPESVLSTALQAYFGTAPWRIGNVHIQTLPFLTQTDYDQLLWICDANFVRGEDSLVRAIWAGKPLVWHIYPQAEDAHHAKLYALLQLLTQQLTPEDTHNTVQFWEYWNGISIAPQAAHTWLNQLNSLHSTQQDWTHTLTHTPSLAHNLVNYINSGKIA